MIRTFHATVRGGRLTINETTDLPEGTLIELVPADDVLQSANVELEKEERELLDRELEAAMAEYEAGRLIDDDE